MPIPRFEYERGYIYGYDYGYNYYNQTMRKQKGRQTNTALSGTINRMTSSRGCNQDCDPLAEGSELGPHAIDEVDGLFNEFRETPKTNERPTRPERPETQPPKNPVRHQTTT